MKISRKWSDEATIFSKLQVHKSIHEGFSFTVTLKAGFCNNALLQIFSLAESCFIEIRTFQVFPEQILFSGVFKPCQTSKIKAIAKIVSVFKHLTIFYKSSILDVLLSSEFSSALIHNPSKQLHSEFTPVKKFNTGTKVIHFSINMFIVNTTERGRHETKLDNV